MAVIIFSVILSLISILYWYMTRNNNYWSKQGVKGPKPVPLFGTILDRLKHSLGEIDVQYMKQYGDIYGIFDGTSPVLHIADPELIKQILVGKFNQFKNRRELRTEHSIFNKVIFFTRSEDWKRLRNIMGSAFTPSKIKGLKSLVMVSLNEYMEHLEAVAQSGKPIDLLELNCNLAADVVTTCAFATKTNALKEPKNPFLLNMRGILDYKMHWAVPAFIFPKFVNKLIGIESFIDKKSLEWLVSFSQHVIEKRKQSEGQEYNDFLQLLMNAKGEDSPKGALTDGSDSQYLSKDEVDVTFETKAFTNKTLTEEEVIAQCWNIWIAGSDTTATTLASLARELVLNPECQQKLYIEVKAAMGTEKEIPFEDLDRLPYLDACVSETLRLYTPVSRLEREACEDLTIGDSKIKLKKGQLIEIPVYAIHRTEKYYKNAEQFNPERFLPENRHKLVPYTFLPFGTGPRNCIGFKFALMEIKLVMAHIIMRYRFLRCDKMEDTLKYKILTLVQSPHSITLRVEKR